MEKAVTNSFIKPEEMPEIIYNFISMKLSVFKNLAGPHKNSVDTMYNVFMQFLKITDQDLENMILLDILCMISMLRHDNPHAPVYTYEMSDRTTGIGANICTYFCNIFTNTLLYHHSCRVPQALPIRLFLGLPVSSLSSFVLTMLHGHKEDKQYIALSRQLNDIVLRHSEENEEKVSASDREPTIYELLSLLAAKKNFPWEPCNEQLQTYQCKIMNVYSDIYTLMITPFEKAYSPYFRKRPLMLHAHVALYGQYGNCFTLAL